MTSADVSAQPSAEFSLLPTAVLPLPPSFLREASWFSKLLQPPPPIRWILAISQSWFYHLRPAQPIPELETANPSSALQVHLPPTIQSIIKYSIIAVRVPTYWMSYLENHCSPCCLPYCNMCLSASARGFCGQQPLCFACCPSNEPAMPQISARGCFDDSNSFQFG